MILIVRVLTILSFLLAAGVLWLCAKDPLWRAPQDRVAVRPSALASYAQVEKEQPQMSRRSVPPLIEAAEVFSAYLNRPPAPPQESAPPITESPVPIAVKPVPASTPFELHGISYHPARPEESLALVWLPADGQRWIRPGAQLGHCTIEQINAYSVVYSNGGQKQEIVLRTPGAISESQARQPEVKPTGSASALIRPRAAPRTAGSHLAARDKIAPAQSPP